MDEEDIHGIVALFLSMQATGRMPPTLGGLRRFLSWVRHNSAAWRQFWPRFGLHVREMHTSGLSAFRLVCGVR
jgi:hypothetical protein